MDPADTLIRNITHEGKDPSMAVWIKKCDLIFFLFFFQMDLRSKNGRDVQRGNKSMTSGIDRMVRGFVVSEGLVTALEYSPIHQRRVAVNSNGLSMS